LTLTCLIWIWVTCLRMLIMTVTQVLDRKFFVYYKEMNKQNKNTEKTTVILDLNDLTILDVYYDLSTIDALCALAFYFLLYLFKCLNILKYIQLILHCYYCFINPLINTVKIYDDSHSWSKRNERTNRHCEKGATILR